MRGVAAGVAFTLNPFARHFTREHKDPYHGIVFVPRTARVRGPDGRVLAEIAGVVVPEGWSQNATDVLATKYMRRAGVPDRTVPRPDLACNELAADAPVPPPEWLAPHVPADDAEFDRELDCRAVFHRLAGAWAYAGWVEGYFWDADEAHAFYDECLYLLARQMMAPNSPQWFGTGLWWAYGLPGADSGSQRVPSDLGRAAVASDAKPTGDTYRHPRASACYIQSVQDNLVGEDGIMDLWQREARVFQAGGGSGVNVSELRAENEPLSGGGKSSGPLSFLKQGDAGAGAIKSAGVTRRAAKIVILDVDHPDVLSFTQWKVHEEQKVAALVAGAAVLRKHAAAVHAAAAAGADPTANPELRRAWAQARHDGVPFAYLRSVVHRARVGLPPPPVPELDCDWQGEAYQTVSGQNANNTVRLSNAFMEAALSGGAHALYYRTELRKAKAAGRVPQPHRVVPAAALFDSICEAAWASADPGVNFQDTVNEWNTCPEDGEIRGANPCQEYNFLDDTCCNLASLNLVAFYDDAERRFRVADYEAACAVVQTVLDITVSMAAYPSKLTAAGAYNYRTTGIGYGNLGALLMRMGLGYDTDMGRAVAAAMTCLMHCAATRTSAFLAERVEPFPRFGANRDHALRVVRNHAALVGADDETEKLSDGYYRLYHPLAEDFHFGYLYEACRASAAAMVAASAAHGLRNAQISCVAPTGTIGPLMDFDTTGCEPDFALVKYKSLAGGGVMKIVNRSVPAALYALGYAAEAIDEVCRHVTGAGSLADAPHRDRLPPAVWAEAEGRLAAAVDVRHVIDPELVPRLSDAEWRAVNRHVFGAMTVEGAPHLRPAHLPVFDCANRCGAGTRYLRPEAHVLMLAAIQPWLSGGISKTLNMPAEATPADVGRMIYLAWKRKVKCCALYRDACKLSQPLTSPGGADWESGGDWEREALAEFDAPAGDDRERLLELLARHSAATLPTDRPSATRRPLPDRRHGFIQKVRVGSQKLFLQTGQYEDGTLGEIFLTMHKEGATFRSLANCFAIAISLGLQHGVPLEEYVNAFVSTKFEPCGVVRGQGTRIRQASSIMDYIFRELAITYLGRDDLANLPPDEVRPTPGGDEDRAAAVDLPEDRDRLIVRGLVAAGVRVDYEFQAARAMGFSGEMCLECGNLTIPPNGRCKKCMTCGFTTGCS